MKTKTVTVNITSIGKWSVKSDTATRAYRLLDTQRQAIQVGRQLAINKRCELIVCRVDGSIRSKDTFPQTDPFPPSSRDINEDWLMNSES